MAFINLWCSYITINKKTIQREKSPIEKLKNSIKIFNLDKSRIGNKNVTEKAKLEIRTKEHKENIQVLVLDITETNIFLGYNWLKQHNPKIDWKIKQLKFSRYKGKYQLEEHKVTNC